MAASSKITMTYICEEDFAQMPQTENGLYCSRCERVVTDFRGLPLEEIFRLKAEKGPGCGIFPAEYVQFEKPYTAPAAPSWLRNGLAALVAMALLETASLQAQNATVLPKDKIVPRHTLVVKEPMRQQRRPMIVQPEKNIVATAPKKKKKRDRRKPRHRRRDALGGYYL